MNDETILTNLKKCQEMLQEELAAYQQCMEAQREADQNVEEAKRSIQSTRKLINELIMKKPELYLSLFFKEYGFVKLEDYERNTMIWFNLCETTSLTLQHPNTNAVCTDCTIKSETPIIIFRNNKMRSILKEYYFVWDFEHTPKITSLTEEDFRAAILGFLGKDVIYKS